MTAFQKSLFNRDCFGKKINTSGETVAGQTKKSLAVVFVLIDQRDGIECFAIIDQRGTAFKTNASQIGRPQARFFAPPFHQVQHS